MVLIFDISSPFQKKPGFMVGDFSNVKNFRCWWLWFALTYSPLNQHDYEEHISSGKTHWVNN